jgi:hypothetical protein
VALSLKEVKEKADMLKSIFIKYRGNKNVVLSVGDKKIKTSYSVDGNDKLKADIENILGRKI